ncbi:MAG: 50S ribosomal protein L13 [Candidatus Diapherotrites archaeon CG10_big_fil_rev_8_21_14_0_10_31_34]|nr:MAG: 50S ribosomal protein L13 [Candidatus Diapherotrites archaeon CG10_big_fil_rev_8_21_14_0_10_31_34]PJA16650.1 MAG: 50S ribosomal protein L13 [Candidatus Diapherotrites archaeon CG_4_10_14_0_2_um_filter_31_5]
MIINAKGLILGRLASKISEKLLNGEKIEVVNAEKVLITGSKEFILSRYKKKVDASVHSNPNYGPKYPRRPDALFKKAVTGMLPKKNKRGKEAGKKLKVYIGEPEEFNKKDFFEIKEAKSQTNEKTVQLGEISKLLGAKW